MTVHKMDVFGVGLYAENLAIERALVFFGRVLRRAADLTRARRRHFP